MSQIPPPFDPIYPPYAGPGVLTPPRPTAITVISIFAISWGSLWLLCTTGSLVMANMTFANMNVNDPLRNIPALRTWNIVSQIVMLALTIAQIGGGIGAINLFRWGRTVLIVWAIATIATTIGQSIGQIILFLPALDQMQPPPNTPPATYRTILHVAMWGGVGFALVLLTWPIIVLYYMSRPRIKEAFGIGTPSVA